MIVYGFVGNVSIRDLFLSGFMPGILFGLALIGCAFGRAGRTAGTPASRCRPRGEIWRAFMAVLPALSMPVVMLGGIFGGVFTPTEAAAVAAIYGFVLAVYVYREVRLGQVPTSCSTPSLPARSSCWSSERRRRWPGSSRSSRCRPSSPPRSSRCRQANRSSCCS